MLAIGTLPALAAHAGWNVVSHGECCEGNLAGADGSTYVLLPSIPGGNDILRSNDTGETWTKIYPPLGNTADFDNWGIEGDLRAYHSDIVYFGTLLGSGIAASSSNYGTTWTVVPVPVASAVNDQAWLYMGPANPCPVALKPYVLAGWFRIGTVVAFSCDGGLTWPIQTPLVGDDGSGPDHIVCQETAHAPVAAGDTRIANAEFARMKAGRHGGWGTDRDFYWSEAAGGFLYICKTNNFGATWEGIRHPLAAGQSTAGPVTNLAFDDKGTLYVLYGNKLYVSFNQGESIAFTQTLPRWGNNFGVGDGAAQWFVVSGGTIHLGIKTSTNDIYYEKGASVDTATPTWSDELVTNAGGPRLDFMQIAMDGAGIPTISYTKSPDFTVGVTTSTRGTAP